MKRFWLVINIGLAVSGAFGGYRSMDPERLMHANPDAVLCGILLVVLPLFSLGAVYYSIRRSRNPVIPHPYVLRRPSWDRNPANWWDDPLQSLFMSTCFLTATAVGAALRWPKVGSVGFWLVGVYFSIAVGLAFGQLLVRCVFGTLLG